MTDQEKSETKLKIMDVAENLFSQFGFDGTSIRDIAKHAEVNVASINYYFKNKHGLYWAVMDEAHIKLEQGFKKIAERVSTVEELTLGGFEFCLTEKKAFRNALKMMIGEDGVPEPDGGVEELYCFRHLGPPGGQYFVEKLVVELPKANQSQIEFAVKSIFSMIIQWSMFSISSKMELMAKADPRFGKEFLQDALRHHCRSTIAYIKTNPDIK